MFGLKKFRKAQPKTQPKAQSMQLSCGTPLRITRARQKRLTLSIHPTSGVVQVRAPRWVSQKTIQQFVAENQNWVAQNLAALPPAIQLAPGAVIPFLDGTRTLLHVPAQRGAADDGVVISIGGDEAFFARRARDYLTRRAKKELQMRASYYAAQLDQTIGNVSVRTMATRWGSCNRSCAQSASKARLSFNWRLVLAPLFVLDYVAAHECAHLKHMNHSAAFWELVTQLYGNPDVAERWLKTHGPALLRVN